MQTDFFHLHRSLGLTFFCDQPFDKGTIKKLIRWWITTYGPVKTAVMLDTLKRLGFHQATLGGISISIHDLHIPDSKTDLIQRGTKDVNLTTERWHNGFITVTERLQKTLSIWTDINERLRPVILHYFLTTNPFNPVYMMAFSGARGNISQVRQLIGMRGLMSDPNGSLIEFPILSNFREGMSVSEYVISCYGARKGLVDTAIRTADAGYLTRRLVDVAQPITVSSADCGTKRSILLKKLITDGKVSIGLEERLVGRVLARTLKLSNKTIVYPRNTVLTPSKAAKTTLLSKGSIPIRSPITCEAHNSVCQLCYGWCLASTRLVKLGDAVGVIAGQSIGEPGTQLTMRTFHTGGVFTGKGQQLVRAPRTGYIKFKLPNRYKTIRTNHGNKGILVQQHCIIRLNSEQETLSIKINANSILLVQNDEKVLYGQPLALMQEGVSGDINSEWSKEPLFAQTSGLIKTVWQTTEPEANNTTETLPCIFSILNLDSLKAPTKYNSFCAPLDRIEKMGVLFYKTNLVSESSSLNQLKQTTKLEVSEKGRKYTWAKKVLLQYPLYTHLQSNTYITVKLQRQNLYHLRRWQKQSNTNKRNTWWAATELRNEPNINIQHVKNKNYCLEPHFGALSTDPLLGNMIQTYSYQSRYSFFVQRSIKTLHKAVKKEAKVLIPTFIKRKKIEKCKSLKNKYYYNQYFSDKYAILFNKIPKTPIASYIYTSSLNKNFYWKNPIYLLTSVSSQNLALKLGLINFSFGRISYSHNQVKKPVINQWLSPIKRFSTNSSKPKVSIENCRKVDLKQKNFIFINEGQIPALPNFPTYYVPTAYLQNKLLNTYITRNCLLVQNQQTSIVRFKDKRSSWKFKYQFDEIIKKYQTYFQSTPLNQNTQTYHNNKKYSVLNCSIPKLKETISFLSSPEKGSILPLTNKSLQITSEGAVLRPNQEKNLYAPLPVLKYMFGQNIQKGSCIETQHLISPERFISPLVGKCFCVNTLGASFQTTTLVLLPTGGNTTLKPGKFCSVGDFLATLSYQKQRTSDIVQGLPRVESIFEGRGPLRKQLTYIFNEVQKSRAFYNLLLFSPEQKLGETVKDEYLLDSSHLSPISKQTLKQGQQYFRNYKKALFLQNWMNSAGLSDRLWKKQPLSNEYVHTTFGRVEQQTIGPNKQYKLNKKSQQRKAVKLYRKNLITAPTFLDKLSYQKDYKFGKSIQTGRNIYLKQYQKGLYLYNKDKYQQIKSFKAKKTSLAKQVSIANDFYKLFTLNGKQFICKVNIAKRFFEKTSFYSAINSDPKFKSGLTNEVFEEKQFEYNNKFYINRADYYATSYTGKYVNTTKTADKQKINRLFAYRGNHLFHRVKRTNAFIAKSAYKLKRLKSVSTPRLDTVFERAQDFRKQGIGSTYQANQRILFHLENKTGKRIKPLTILTKKTIKRALVILLLTENQPKSILNKHFIQYHSKWYRYKRKERVLWRLYLLWILNQTYNINLNQTVNKHSLLQNLKRYQQKNFAPNIEVSGIQKLLVNYFLILETGRDFIFKTLLCYQTVNEPINKKWAYMPGLDDRYLLFTSTIKPYYQNYLKQVQICDVLINDIETSWLLEKQITVPTFLFKYLLRSPSSNHYNVLSFIYIQVLLAHEKKYTSNNFSSTLLLSLQSQAFRKTFTLSQIIEEIMEEKTSLQPIWVIWSFLQGNTAWFPLDMTVLQDRDVIFYSIQLYALQSIQAVYLSQGVTIADKHIEIIIHQVISRILIETGGSAPYLAGESSGLERFQSYKKRFTFPAIYIPNLRGMTKTALSSASFLSGASFQETKKVLSRAALINKVDFLEGLKENVIIGQRIPAGTGAESFILRRELINSVPAPTEQFHQKYGFLLDQIRSQINERQTITQNQVEENPQLGPI
uniref:DNA-directed RNA polymerase n=1 Tax=prasinophyte sp. MBIC10622 TaxID=156113 RepID=A0A088CKL2_9CHLO|nr:beta'' subunit of RNA polymerase [prasinophyte sp. MBIC10622]